MLRASNSIKYKISSSITTPNGIWLLREPVLIPGTNLLSDFARFPGPNPRRQDLLEAVQGTFTYLNERLGTEGDVPIGDDGIRMLYRTVVIEVSESDLWDMTYNDTINALTGLMIYEERVGFKACIGDIYNAESWRYMEPIGFISLRGRT